MKASLIAAAIAAVALPSGVAMAQGTTAGAVAPTVGAKVYGPQGDEVGTVEAVQDGVVVVNTGTAKGGIPIASFAMRAKGLTIGYTKAQLETALGAAAADSGAKLDAALVADASVKSADDVVLGTVSKREGDDVTLALSEGGMVQLKKQSFGLDATGGLKIGMTAAALKSAMTAAAPATPATPATPAAPATAAAEATGPSAE
ncbi:hypothetical protein [Novosphingobium colocasiae]|uniref:hypothetical protein n=1 Tax=Novosphingobium colocasiae TaxID=1256513 RepID=UPI0035B3DFBE